MKQINLAPWMGGVFMLVGGLTFASEDCHLNDDGTQRHEPAPGANEECVQSVEPNPTRELRAGNSRGLSAASLTTLFAEDNSFAGNTFDLEPNTDLTVTGFDINIDGDSSTIAIYWRDGTANGNQGSSAGWNLMGTDTVTPAGPDNPTPVDIGGLDIDAGNTYGIYVDVQSYPSASMLYTNGGPTTFSNVDLDLTTYHGKGNPAFTGSDFFPRQWNGTVYYEPRAVAEPVSVPVGGPVGLVVLVLLLCGSALVLLRKHGFRPFAG